jgi:hypothetical protein
MSIASASLVPTLPVNGLQFLNPALKKVILATDANGYVVADSAGSVLSNPVITENPNTVINAISPTNSNCQILQIGKLVNFATKINFNIRGAIPSGAGNYVFQVPAFPPIQSVFTDTSSNIPYNHTYSLTQPNTQPGGGPDINILSTGAFIDIENFGSGAGAYTGIALNQMDFSTADSSQSCTLEISGSYFAQ